jgi:hypothetical protein
MVSMWYAMREALAIVGDEGLEAMWERHFKVGGPGRGAARPAPAPPDWAHQAGPMLVPEAEQRAGYQTGIAEDSSRVPQSQAPGARGLPACVVP